MGGGVVAFSITPSVAWHRRARGAEGDFAGAFAECRDAPVDAAHFVNVDAPAFALNFALVGDLTAGLYIKRRLAQHHRDSSVGQILLGDDLRAHVERVVAYEFGAIAFFETAFRFPLPASRLPLPRPSAEYVASESNLLRSPIFLRHLALR